MQRQRNGMSNANSSAGLSRADHKDTFAVAPTAAPTSSSNDCRNTKFDVQRTDAIQPHIKHPQSSMTLRKSVSFTEVNIREYERILGDNPSCSSGAPISLGWNYCLSRSLPIDDFEMVRSLHRRNSPKSMPWRDRKDVLLEWGATFSEITNAVRETNKAKHKRRRTVQSIGRYDRFEEALETATQKLKQTLSLEKVYKNHLGRRLGNFRGGKISSDDSRGSSQSQSSSESATPSILSRDDYPIAHTPGVQLGKAPNRPIKLSVSKTESDYSTVVITPSVSSRDEPDILGRTTDDEKQSLRKKDKPVTKPVRSPSLSHSGESMSSTTEDLESSPFATSETSCDIFSSFSTINTREESTVCMSSFSTHVRQEEIDDGMTFAVIQSKVHKNVGDCDFGFSKKVKCDDNLVIDSVPQNSSSNKERSPNATDPEDDEASIPSHYLNLLDDGSVASEFESQVESIHYESVPTVNDVTRSANVSLPMRFGIPKPFALRELAEC